MMLNFWQDTFIVNTVLVSSFLIIANAGDDYTSIKNEIRKKIGHLEISVGEKIIVQACEEEDELALFAELGFHMKNVSNVPEWCQIENKSDHICLKWDSYTSLEITKLNGFCHEVTWNTTEPVEDCFDYMKMNWYGGSENSHQYWPIEKVKLINVPFVTSNFLGISLAEPFWMNSKGLLISVNNNVPLFIDSNNHRSNSLCLISNATFPYNSDRNKQLKYLICQLDNPRKAHEYAVQLGIISKPLNIPDERMVKYPIWSTWVQFKADINETAVLQFAEEIVIYGFNNSQIEIDDNWETCYGTMTFNKTKFPDIKSLSMKLEKLGFRITLWRHPFVNTNCENYSVLKQNGFFVTNASGFDTTEWWNGNGSVFDFTNVTVKKWFQKKHQKLLKESGIDGFKFDAGETSYIPMNSLLQGDPNDYPKSYTLAYEETIAAFGRLTETRVGHNSQRFPIYMRMLDKNSLWDFNGGLPTLITTCLLMNIIGYPWVLPDMVAGNAYGTVISEELFIRWLQANTFMPVIQFSFAPWNFNNKTVIDITKKFTSLHYEYSDLIIELMKKTVKTGAPLNAPVWWIDPKNPEAHSIDSEYLLGEDILVAPVLEEGATERDVYLPKGEWRDGNNKDVIYSGPLWLRNYAADILTLPFFIRISCGITE